MACQKPAKLWVDTAATQPVTLPATQPGQSAAVAPRSMYIANKGNTSLVVALQAVHRSDSVLRPELWLSPASGYTATFGGVGPAEGCSSDSSQVCLPQHDCSAQATAPLCQSQRSSRFTILYTPMW